MAPSLAAHFHAPTPPTPPPASGEPPCLCSTCPALAALFAHIGIVSKQDSNGLQVPQGHGQFQGGAPPWILLFNVVLGETGHSAQSK